MRSYRQPLAAIAIFCCLFAACGSDKPAASGSAAAASTTAASSAAATGASTAATTPAATGGTAAASAGTGAPVGNGTQDCAALKTTLAGLTANWQVVVGTLPHAPTSDWAAVPLGNIKEFGNQLEAATAALGKNSQAAGALSYMSGANDIVVRGLGGDSSAQADLATYLGPDAQVSINKQIPIALAFQNAGCS